RFTNDTAAKPMRIDIEFDEGPEAGNSSYGIFELDGDQLTICLGVVGATRPEKFATRAGTGHALERLRRASAQRPAGVTGGVAASAPAAPTSAQASVDPGDFTASASPMLDRLEGTWLPVRLVTDGEEMKAEWLPYGSRT